MPKIYLNIQKLIRWKFWNNEILSACLTTENDLPKLLGIWSPFILSIKVNIFLHLNFLVVTLILVLHHGDYFCIQFLVGLTFFFVKVQTSDGFLLTHITHQLLVINLTLNNGFVIQNIVQCLFLPVAIIFCSYQVSLTH